MTTAIKICGISTVEALDAAIEARAQYAGFVFFPPSPRHIDGHAASALAMRGGDRIGRVGLFVDADDGLIAESVKAGRLGALLLHGKETPERVAEVKARFGLPVWKAISIAGSRDVERDEAYRPVADLLLFDAKTPDDAALPGGMGLRFGWSLLDGWKGRPGWGLAGGLTPQTVAGAIQQLRPPLVDTSSGVESAPGVKDAPLIHAFCEAVRNA